MAKAELFKIPIFSWLIRRLGAIPVRRGALDRKGLTTCRNLLKEGRALLIFPEGTRTQNGEMGEVKPGAALLVADLPDVSIVPVYVKGSFRAMPRGKWFPRPVRVAIRFGAPFKIPQKEVEMDKKKYYQNICFQLLNAIKALKNNARIDPEDHHL